LAGKGLKLPSSNQFETAGFDRFHHNLPSAGNGHILTIPHQVVLLVVLDGDPEQPVIHQQSSVVLEIEGENIILIDTARKRRRGNRFDQMLDERRFIRHKAPPSKDGRVSILFNIVNIVYKEKFSGPDLFAISPALPARASPSIMSGYAGL